MARFGRDDMSRRPGMALVWATCWAVGAAGGVALGARLTVAGAGAVPGQGGAAADSAVYLLPLWAFFGVFTIYLVIWFLAVWFRGRRSSSRRNDSAGRPV